MLEQTKTVLLNVSFDSGLFRKELKKAIRWLKPSEIENLGNWCKENFTGQCYEIVSELMQANPYF